MPKWKKRQLRLADGNFTGEVEYIVGRAKKLDCRVVKLGQLVFFSTQTGDAWMLDPEDGFAACLAQGGESQPINILESEKRMVVEWTANYRIDGAAFIVQEKISGRIRTILGYPTKAIADAAAF